MACSLGDMSDHDLVDALGQYRLDFQLKPAHHQTFGDLLDVLGGVDPLAQPVFAQLHVLFPCSSRLAELLKKTQIVVEEQPQIVDAVAQQDRKSTRLNSSH